MSSLVITEPSPFDVATGVTLISKENTPLLTTYGIVRLSKTVTGFLEEASPEDAPFVVPVPNVTTATLGRILDYLKFHYDTVEQYAIEWDRAFIANLAQSDLFELIMGANYLDIKPLFDLSCQAVADMIKGKTPQEIRIHFSIPNDFTPEEEAEVLRENAWAEEQHNPGSAN